MIVLDTSAAVSALLNAGAARDVVVEEALFAPHLIDTEVTNALRRLGASGRLDAGDTRLAGAEGIGCPVTLAPR